MFTITISTDNAAFEGESLRPEIARILEKVASQVRTMPEGWNAEKKWNCYRNITYPSTVFNKLVTY